MPDADMTTNHAATVGPRWDLYRYFLAVAKTESITGAAQLLRESAPTVSRRIRELEAHFSDALFTRAPGRLSLSQEGAQLRERLTRVDADLGAIQSDLIGAQADLRGHVTIAAPRGFGKTVLLNCLGDLRREMPEVTFTTIFETKKANLTRREADIAVRIGDPGDEGMTARHIGEITFGLYASADYLRTRNAPASIADLPAGDYVGLTHGNNLPQIAEIRELAPHLSPGITLDCILLQAQTVALGFGYAPLPDYLTVSFPGLVKILPGVLSRKADVWVLSQPDFSGSACVRATVQALVTAAQAAMPSEQT